MANAAVQRCEAPSPVLFCLLGNLHRRLDRFNALKCASVNRVPIALPRPTNEHGYDAAFRVVMGIVVLRVVVSGGCDKRE